MTAPIANLSRRLRASNGVLVDTNILLDIATRDPEWSAWSEAALSECAEQSTLVINPIVYAELSIGFSTIEALDAALPRGLYHREPLPYEAGFLAGKAFLMYRRRGGARNTTLPDFYIGAHAAIANLAVLTRDEARFETYFPKLEILSPAKEPQ